MLSSALATGTAQLFLRASQLGYCPADPKNAMAFGDGPLPEHFAVVDAASGKEVFRGVPKPLPGEHWGRFQNHAELDFTALRSPGRFRVAMGGFSSHPFVIAADAFATLPDACLEFMRQQRCGNNPWLGTNCHQLDGRTAYGPVPAGTPIDARGGWHDAGDLLKYLLTSGNATAQMLLAWQLTNSASGDRVDALGNPRTNGIPDILDEARWGLDWMLKLHPAPDQLYHQVADDRDHIGFRLPQNETADYGWGKGGPRVVYAADGQAQGLSQFKSASTGLANLAGRHAAALALAWQVWQNDFHDYSTNEPTMDGTASALLLWSLCNYAR
ncbi:MAG: glycoside hydrolase family 9 protein [Verrucomicrobia bacterium]|nr:glycoside hydrolase family 9 protein [Verrucomicrobiota bacterium]